MCEVPFLKLLKQPHPLESFVQLIWKLPLCMRVNAQTAVLLGLSPKQMGVYGNMCRQLEKAFKGAMLSLLGGYGCFCLCQYAFSFWVFAQCEQHTWKDFHKDSKLFHVTWLGRVEKKGAPKDEWMFWLIFNVSHCIQSTSLYLEHSVSFCFLSFFL